jgi:hypothetical protein
VYSKFFDNMGPIPHHMHQNAKQAKLVGQEGKPESYYFPPQHNNVGNNFPYTFMGLEPGTTKAQVRKCLEDWNKGDNGILDLSKAYRLKPGTGWLIGPASCTRRARSAPTSRNGAATCSACIRAWSKAATCRGPAGQGHAQEQAPDLDFIVDQLDWEETSTRISRTTITSNPCPWPTRARKGFVDRWIVYGKINGEQFSPPRN